MNREAFAKMKKTAILINVARGPVVDEEALYEALTTGAIAAAGLDHIRFTDLRHTCAVLSLQNGMEAGEVARLLGHTRQHKAFDYTAYGMGKQGSQNSLCERGLSEYQEFSCRGRKKCNRIES